jgi:hypothetical protein
MAKPTTYKGSLIAIYLEDPASAGEFVKPCGLNQTSVSFTKNAQEVNVPDCDDPEAPQWVERDVESLDFSASGEGVLAAESVETWYEYFASTDSVNARIYVGSPSDVANGYYWEGKVHVTGFSVEGVTGTRATCTVELASDGELTFVKIST